MSSIPWTSVSNASYTQLCIMQGQTMSEDRLDLFQTKMKEWFGLSHDLLVVGVVETLPTPGEPDTGGRHDFCFLVHDEDVLNLSHPARFSIGIRWWEDVLLNGNAPIYPEDFRIAYPPTWK